MEYLLTANGMSIECIHWSGWISWSGGKLVLVGYFTLFVMKLYQLALEQGEWHSIDRVAVVWMASDSRKAENMAEIKDSDWSRAKNPALSLVERNFRK